MVVSVVSVDMSALVVNGGSRREVEGLGRGEFSCGKLSVVVRSR